MWWFCKKYLFHYHNQCHPCIRYTVLTVCMQNCINILGMAANWTPISPTYTVRGELAWRSFIKPAHFHMTKSDSWESPGIFTIAFNKHVAWLSVQNSCRCVLFWCSAWRKTIQAHQSLRHVSLAQKHFKQIWTHSSEKACLGQQNHNDIFWYRQEYVHYYIYCVNNVSLVKWSHSRFKCLSVM